MIGGADGSRTIHQVIYCVAVPVGLLCRLITTLYLQEETQKDTGGFTISTSKQSFPEK